MKIMSKFGNVKIGEIIDNVFKDISELEFLGSNIWDVYIIWKNDEKSLYSLYYNYSGDELDLGRRSFDYFCQIQDGNIVEIFY